MYRAVMEEVSRFLERCTCCLESIQHSNKTIERSKSVVQVFKNIDSDSTDSSAPSCGSHRARSSTNLLEVPQFKKRCHADSNHSFYNNFVDFTL